MGLAYEIVINSNPCIAYLMEENTMTMQALVIAHACYGHNSFFKNNYLYRTWTDASSIIDYLVFAKQYLSQCEERHGVEEVEKVLDSCHALMNHGVDRYKRPHPVSPEEERRRQRERAEYIQRNLNDLWRTVPRAREMDERDDEQFPKDPQENLLYFIEKNAPLLEPWQREIVRIVRKIAQYFYPQRQTQVMNEGWATFWHYTLLNALYDEGKVTDGFMMEFLHVAHRRDRINRASTVRTTAASIPMRSASRCTRICGGSASTRPTKTASGSATSPARRGSKCSITRCATSRTRASSCSSCRRR